MQGCSAANKAYKYKAFKIESDLTVDDFKKDAPLNTSHANRTELYEFIIPKTIVEKRDTLQLKLCLISALKACHYNVTNEMLHSIHLSENADGTGIFLGCAFYRNHWKHSQTYDWQKGSIRVMMEYYKF